MLKQIDEHIKLALEKIGIEKEKFDKVISTLGWVILVYLVVKYFSEKEGE